jgi:alpha-galactosidase
MVEPVTSGLGRIGPWLQNAWLRVETRLDDASISPVALRPSYRPLERAVALAKPVAEPPLEFHRADYDVRLHDDALGRGRVVTLTSRPERRGVALRLEVILYDDNPAVFTRLGVTNERDTPLRIETLHAFASPATPRARLQFAVSPDDLRIYRHGWQSWSPTLSLPGSARDVQSSPTVLAPEAPQVAPGRFASDDVAVLYDPGAGRSFLAGAVTARDFISQVMVDVPSRSIDARCIADGIPVRPSDTVWSERFAVDLCGSANEQLERYGDALAREMGGRVPASPPAGWCSWYYFYTTVTEDDVLRNLRFLERNRRELPVNTVQIDDGYQADIGDWLTVNEKFPHGMRWLASQIRDAGFVPGIWLAPFLVAETSRQYREHPGHVVRDPSGEPALAMDNWQRRNFAIDGTNPQALDWLRELFGEICEGWGYDYLKVDFLFAGAIAGVRHDPAATRVQAYRRALTAVRERAGQRFVLGCGSLMAPSVGLFDGNRIGPDVAPFWRFLTSEERASPRPRPRAPDDLLSAETAVRNTMTRAWMHGRLWANDPDCLLVRADRTKLTLDETRTLATAIGLSGGMVLSSDDLEPVLPERLELISMLLPPLPVSARPVDLMERDIPAHFEARLDREWDPLRLVAVFNFDDEPGGAALPLPDGTWHAFELWERRYLGARVGQVDLGQMAPHSCRLLALRPVRRPLGLVATDAHIGMGAIDVQGCASGADELTLRLTPAGRRRRTIFLAVPDGARVAAKLGEDVVQVASGGPLARIEVEVDVAMDLRVSLG